MNDVLLRDPALLTAALRVAGVSHVVLGVAHAPLWRFLGWSDETARLSPLTSRVFAVHTFFVALVIVALGLPAALRPALLVDESDGALLFLGFCAAFWALRLVAQPLVFDPVLLLGSPRRPYVRAAAVAGFGAYVLVYAWAIARQLDLRGLVLTPRAIDLRAPADVARVVVAAVWLGYGVGCKLLRLVPRHERIVARILGPILGDAAVPPLTRLIGAGEACVGLWMLSGVYAPACAALQTALVVTMNAIELKKARDLLFAPIPMVLANAALLAAAWLAACGAGVPPLP